MATVAGGAAWAGLADLPEAVLDMHSPTDWAGYLDTATDVLWAASGRRWRGGPVTETVALRAAAPRQGEPGWPYHRSWGSCPCVTGYSAGYGSTPLWAAGWTNLHTAPAAVRLPRPDVTSVVSVTIDGAPFAGWRPDGSWLARIDGGTWPVCGDRTTVVYEFGRQPPAGGVRACVELAVELGRAGCPEPDQPCQLPKRLQSVTRQGITAVPLDDLSFLDNGLTGLYAVDLWLRGTNPKGRTQAATVWSPDLPMAQRR